jgi:hypothetical protein
VGEREWGEEGGGAERCVVVGVPGAVGGSRAETPSRGSRSRAGTSTPRTSSSPSHILCTESATTPPSPHGEWRCLPLPTLSPVLKRAHPSAVRVDRRAEPRAESSPP